MRLRSISVANLGVFESAKAELARDAAVIVGKNNSGKTSLLTMMAMQVQPGLPRTVAVERLPKQQRAELKQRVAIEVEVERADLEAVCRSAGAVAVPLIPGNDKKTILDAVNRGELRVVREERWKGGKQHSNNSEAAFGVVPQHSLVFELSAGQLKFASQGPFENGHIHSLLSNLGESLFRYDADRSRASEKTVRRMPSLDPRGEELVTAFNHLHAEQQLEFLAIAQRVLPEITRFKSQPSQDGHTQLRMWFGADHRDELSFNLGEVGYGTANVLALLFVATMDPGRRIILIDEPATYLHPSAVRELMAVLAENPRHQYIFATHSFAGLEHFPNASFSLCQRVPGRDVATIKNLGGADAGSARMALREVGASLSDVFAADKVIWTEGLSDADVLKIVLQDAKAPRGISVLPIIHTGDFDASDIKPDKAGKRRSLAAHIYESLSKNSALIPPALAFVFDREKRNPTQLEDLKRQIEGNDPTKRDRPRFFLYDEFMLENLFLDPDLVAALLTQVAADPDRPAKPQHPVSPAAVEQCWDALDDVGHFLAPMRAADPAAWRTSVHGARVLDATFDHFFGDTVEFIKAKHDPLLARLALELDGPAARRLRAFGKRILEVVKDPEGAA